MDDASFASGQMGLDQGMGGGPDMGMDPGMGGDPNMGMDQGGEDMSLLNGDPNAMGGDQGMGVDPGMDGDPGMEPGEGEGTGDDTESIIKQLSPTDKEAVRAYAESMLNRDETQGGGQEQQPMMERVIFTKKQIQQIHENFGPSQDELNKETQKNRKELPKKTTKTTSNNSPFRPKQFN